MVRSQNFVINLERDLDKKAHMQFALQRVDLSACFLNAVDGRAMSSDVIDAHTQPEVTLGLLGRLLTVGEVGCALSHRSAMERIVDERLDFAMICEDDIDFSPEVPRVLDALNLMPVDWDVLLLGHHGPESWWAPTNCSFWYRNRLANSFDVRRPCERSYGTYCYCISQRGAKKLLPLLQKISLPIDFYTGNPDLINLYVVKKPLVQLSDRFVTHSNIEYERKEAERHITVGPRSGMKNAIRETIRSMGLLGFSAYARRMATRLYKKFKPMVPYT